MQKSLHEHVRARALAEGADSADAEVRLRQVRELAPEEAINSNAPWQEHREATVDTPEATHADLEWADGSPFGTPARFGLPSAQLKQFMDGTGSLWSKGKLADKVATSFTSAGNTHGGLESTILALNNVFYHRGSVIIAPGYTDPLLYAAGGNPYGTSWASGGKEGPDDAVLESARYQGRRLARYADVVADAREAMQPVSTSA